MSKLNFVLRVGCTATLASIVAITGYWTLTGHCCGIPIITTEWDACLPYGDEMPFAFMRSGHCDTRTRTRVP